MVGSAGERASGSSGAAERGGVTCIPPIKRFFYNDPTHPQKDPSHCHVTPLLRVTPCSATLARSAATPAVSRCESSSFKCCASTYCEPDHSEFNVCYAVVIAGSVQSPLQSSPSIEIRDVDTVEHLVAGVSLVFRCSFAVDPAVALALSELNSRK